MKRTGNTHANTGCVYGNSLMAEVNLNSKVYSRSELFTRIRTNTQNQQHAKETDNTLQSMHTQIHTGHLQAAEDNKHEYRQTLAFAIYSR